MTKIYPKQTPNVPYSTKSYDGIAMRCYGEWEKWFKSVWEGKMNALMDGGVILLIWRLMSWRLMSSLIWHLLFLFCYPYKYWTGSMQLNFVDLARTNALCLKHWFQLDQPRKGSANLPSHCLVWFVTFTNLTKVLGAAELCFIIIITFMSCYQHEYLWPSLATPPYRPLLPAGLQDYILCQLLYVSSSWSSCLCSAMWRGPLEYITYELAPTSPAVSHISGLSNLDSFCDGW